MEFCLRIFDFRFSTFNFLEDLLAGACCVNHRWTLPDLCVIHLQWVSAWDLMRILWRIKIWISDNEKFEKTHYNLFSNSLIIHEVNHQPQDVYHITCMCLDTQWNTVYHSPVRVVYTTKIYTMTTCTKSMNIYYSEVTFCFQSHIHSR